MRLLQAMAGADRGGAEGFFERLTCALQRTGAEQRVLIRQNPRRARLLRASGIAVTEMPFGGALDIVTRLGFRKAVATFKPDVVLTWMNRASKFCPQGDYVRVGRLGGYYDLKYYQGFDHLVGNTQDICDWIMGQGWSRERVHYLPNFVDCAKAEPVARPEGKVILALGRLHENKAFDVLIKAMPAIPGAQLWLAGEGPLRAELEKLAAALGVTERVCFLGWREDVAALMAAADIFVCPSRHEPLGNVVIEAWAQGLPVVAAASEGPRQLITPGTNGLLAAVDDPVELAAAITEVVVDAAFAARLGAGGRAAYERDFTEAAVVARYLAFFDKVTR